MARRDEQGIRCSFCGKRETQVERMISDPVCILQRLRVRLCGSLLDDDYTPPSQKRQSSGYRRRRPPQGDQDLYGWLHCGPGGGQDCPVGGGI